MNKKVISVILSLMLITGIPSGCKNDKKQKTDKPEPLLPGSVADSGIDIVTGGQSDYKIVIPENAEKNILDSASEMQFFIQSASGAVLPVEENDDMVFNGNDKIISLGDTSVFKTSGLSLSRDLGLTGYKMKRMGNTLIINANDANGVIDGVYDMLNYTVDLEIYASDEIYFRKTDRVPLPDFDIEFRPTIDVRSMLLKNLNADSTYMRRMRLYTAYGTGLWISFAHTTVSRYITIAEYGMTHPEYFNSSQTQVCYSNEEMRKEMVRKIEKDIEEHPDGKYVMIGHEDNYDMCECEQCRKAREKLGGYGGQEIDFTNKVAEDVDKWLEENYPERAGKVKYVFFAYQTSAAPPARKDESTGKYVPVNSDFDVQENVMVLYCPIETDFSKKLHDIKNRAQLDKLSGWGDIFRSRGRRDNVAVWTYSIPVLSYFTPMDNFGVYGEHYKTFSDSGVGFVLDQSVHSSGIPCFECLKAYTQTKLMYRNDLSYNDLVYDFIEHYYGQASGKIREYYDYIRAYYKYLENNKGLNGSIRTNTSEQIFWPYETVMAINEILEEAIKELEPLKATDSERYETLYARVKREQLVPVYLLFTYYMDLIPQTDKERYWNDMKKYTYLFDITASAEGQNDVADKIRAWKEKIFI